MKLDTNFERVMTALRCQEEPDRVPISEFHFDRDFMDAFMGYRVSTLEERIRFWVEAGLDYIVFPAGLLVDTQPVPGLFQEGQGHYSIYNEQQGKRQWAQEGEGIIREEKDLEKIPSLDLERLDLSRFFETSRLLPPGMKIMVLLGNIYAKTTQFFGVENFFFTLIEKPALVEAVIERIGFIQFKVLEAIVELDCVGGIWHPDDLAYNQGLFIAPKYLRKWIFPQYSRMNELSRNRGKGTVLHCDGNPTEVLDDIIESGFMGLQPIQSNVMDIRALKKKYGRNLCLIGNVDMDRLMCRGTPDMIREEVKHLIRDVAPGGGYMAGSGNSIADFVPVQNYRALLDAIHEFGSYPIQI